MKPHHLLLVAAVGAVLFSACKKDPANEVPRVSITSPADGASLTVPDTLVVTLDAMDDIGLEQVAVSLLDQNQVPVVASVGRAVSGKSVSITLRLPINSQQLSSGIYTLYATAYDGSLTGKDFRALHVTAAPLRVRAIYTVAVADGSTALYKTDSLGQTTVAGNWPMDLGGAAVGSAAQRLFIAGGITGDLQALSTDAAGTAWQLPNLSTGLPWFTSVDQCADGALYVGLGNGTVRGFNARNGTGAFNATMPPQFRATQTVVSGTLVICTERHLVTQEQRLGIHYLGTGAQQETQPLDMEPVRIFDRDGQHLLIFGNRNGMGVVQDRSIAGGSGWEPYTWPQAITATERVEQGTWLVALANGDLHRFTFNNAGSLVVATTPVLHTMTLNTVDNRVYAGAEGQVIAIDPTTGTFAPAWTVAGSVRYVLPLLNR